MEEEEEEEEIHGQYMESKLRLLNLAQGSARTATSQVGKSWDARLAPLMKDTASIKKAQGRHYVTSPRPFSTQASLQ